MMAFSSMASFMDKGWGAAAALTGSRASQLSSTEKVVVSQTISERSTIFCSSRMLPGQS